LHMPALVISNDIARIGASSAQMKYLTDFMHSKIFSSFSCIAEDSSLLICFTMTTG
jgi:hypothetical protein